jgi:hypothetical protein
MGDERRYHEDEVAQIFEAASAPEVSRLEAGPSEGLTLAELQAIGRDVGIAPERIADAASSLVRSQTQVPRRTDFGIPVSVGHTIELSRQLTDREWALVVADLRETFSARGRDSSQGDTRQWSNGNLQAFVEPTRSGYRFRLGTVKGNAVALNRLGAAGLVMGVVVLVAPMLSAAGADFANALLIAGMGAGALAFNALRQPRWAREREQQMKEIAERTRALLGPGADSETG